jgi:hypothetical protein
MNQLAEMVRSLAGSESPVVHVPYGEAYAEGFGDLGRQV